MKIVEGESPVKIVHVAEYDPEKLFEVVVAWCGRTALMYPDGKLEPGDYDFVLPPFARHADCEACIAKGIERAQGRAIGTAKQV